MIRRVIEIDRDKCNGCGACAQACHEGAIGMVEGKAALLRDDYCDGLGNCLPACPTGAITFVEREAAPFDPQAVAAAQAAQAEKTPLPCGCPGSAAGVLCPGSREAALPPQDRETAAEPKEDAPRSCLGQWPVQLRLLPVQAPFYQGARLLAAADCSAFSRSDFHERFMRGRITVIGCPKLDEADYAEKLTEILRLNDIRSLTVVRMEVPCCGGIQRAAEEALSRCGKVLPYQVVTLSRDGRILEDV